MKSNLLSVFVVSTCLVLENLRLIYKCFIKTSYLQNQQQLHDHLHTGEYCDWGEKKNVIIGNCLLVS